jgi:hypothetical protein
LLLNFSKNKRKKNEKETLIVTQDLPFFGKEVSGGQWGRAGEERRGEGRVCEGRKRREFVRGANGRESERGRKRGDGRKVALLETIMSTGQLFSRTTQSLFYNYKQSPVQRMLDFDFLCGK